MYVFVTQNVMISIKKIISPLLLKLTLVIDIYNEIRVRGFFGFLKKTWP